MEKKVSEIFEEITSAMCDEYCKWPEKIKADYPDDYDQCEAMTEICEKCPLMRL